MTTQMCLLALLVNFMKMFYVKVIQWYNMSTFLNNILLVLNDNCDLPTCIVGDFHEDILCKSDKSICKFFHSVKFVQKVTSPM